MCLAHSQSQFNFDIGRIWKQSIAIRTEMLEILNSNPRDFFRFSISSSRAQHHLMLLITQIRPMRSRCRVDLTDLSWRVKSPIRHEEKEMLQKRENKRNFCLPFWGWIVNTEQICSFFHFPIFALASWQYKIQNLLLQNFTRHRNVTSALYCWFLISFGVQTENWDFFCKRGCDISDKTFRE